jgi:hypothetical protein
VFHRETNRILTDEELGQLRLIVYSSTTDLAMDLI